MDKSMLALVLIVAVYFLAKKKLFPRLAKRKAEKQDISGGGGVGAGAGAPALDLSGMGLDAVKGGVPCGVVPLSALSSPSPTPSPVHGMTGFNCAIIEILSDEVTADLCSEDLTSLERARLLDTASLEFKRQVDTMLAALNNRGAYDVVFDYLPCGLGSYLVCATYKLPSSVL